MQQPERTNREGSVTIHLLSGLLSGRRTYPDTWSGTRSATVRFLVDRSAVSMHTP
jgi:hypothetical protein